MNSCYYKIRRDYAEKPHFAIVNTEGGLRAKAAPTTTLNTLQQFTYRKTEKSVLTALLLDLNAAGIPYCISQKSDHILITA